MQLSENIEVRDFLIKTLCYQQNFTNNKLKTLNLTIYQSLIHAFHNMGIYHFL